MPAGWSGFRFRGESSELMYCFLLIFLYWSSFSSYYIRNICCSPITGKPNQRSNAAVYHQQLFNNLDSNQRVVRDLTKDAGCRLWPSLNIRGNDEDLVWSESADRIFEKLDSAVYNKHQAPGQSTGNTTMVNVAFYIESMSTFRAQSMDFEVDMYLALSWVDQRLRHNCSHPVLVTDVQMHDMMWHPDLYFVNSKVAFIHQVTRPNFMVLIYKDGMVFKSVRIDVVLSCLLRLEYFPMDQQECSVRIQSYAYVQNVLNLSWHVDKEKGYPISFNDRLREGLSDMNLIDKSWGRCDFDYPMFKGSGRWSCLQGNLIMKRKLQFHLFQLFIPTAILVCISWLSFWLDVRASPARITLTITTLLTLTTMSNGSRQSLPQVSYMKSIDRWVAACQGFVFCVLLEFSLVNYLLFKKTFGCKKHLVSSSASQQRVDHHKTGCSKSLPTTIVDLHVACGVCADQWERYAKRVDNISRGLFPLGFAVFVIAYWFSYYEQLQAYELF